MHQHRRASSRHEVFTLCLATAMLAGVSVAQADVGADPALPEPMVVDLAQGLGAAQGEVEINTLVLVPVFADAVFWAPELEVAVVDNFAVEPGTPFCEVASQAA